eukprot:7001609-Lingulodinium_polyedra.AAC.1
MQSLGPAPPLPGFGGGPVAWQAFALPSREQFPGHGSARDEERGFIPREIGCRVGCAGATTSPQAAAKLIVQR